MIIFLSVMVSSKLEIQSTKEPINSRMRRPNYRYVSTIKISRLDSSSNKKVSLDIEKDELIFDALLGCYQYENIKKR